MPSDPLIDRLVRDLKPVRPRSAWMDGAMAGLLFGLELAIFIGVGAARPDMPMAMGLPSFWWKLSSCGVLAFGGAVTAILSFDPVASPLRGLRWLVVLALFCIAAGWFVDAAQNGLAPLVARLNWSDGLQCVYKMVALSVPPIIGLGLLMRRGAPTRPAATAWAVGIAAAGWGAFVFVFACPHDDPLYIVVWYVVGCGLVTLLARWLLPVLTRW